MNLRTPLRPLAASLLAFLCASVLATQAADAPKKLGKKAAEAEQLFTSESIPHLQIEIPPEGIKELEKYSFQFGQTEQQERAQVKAIVREGDKVYKDVAVQMKGAAGSFRSIHDNPALTLNFDKFIDGQTFHGLDKLSLNNSVQDQTFVSEQFSREMFLKAGVPVPRATHATVELNGRDLGLYVLVQGWNKRFLRQHFEKVSGNLYDGGFLKDVDQKLDTNSGDNPDDQSDRIKLVAAAQEKDLSKRRERLEKVLDMDRFLTFIAMDVMLWNWDGYGQNKNNYRLFSDQASGKMVFMPHGLDQMFWKPDGPILPGFEGMVAKAALQIPDIRQRYLARIKELRTTVFNPQEMTNRVHKISAKVLPVLKKKDSSLAAQQETAVAAFTDAIVRRARSIDEQLATPIVPLRFDANGTATLTGWQSATLFGKPDLEKKGESLQARTTKGSSIGAWRTKIWLEPGEYQFEAKIKTTGIKPDLGDTRAGAGLRVGRERSDKFVTGDNDWTTINHRFSVSDPLAQMQFQCEFRGIEGEAEFQSIQLTKLPHKNESK